MAQLTSSLVRALRRLGDVGEPTTAACIAAEAYVALRHDHAPVAERLNQVMHYLARLERAGQDQEGSDAMTDELILDVRSEPPVRRHAVIFETFEALAPGTRLVLVNDHDPKPLYYQLAAEQPGMFTWDCLESGPVVWRVRIGRIETAAATAEA